MATNNIKQIGKSSPPVQTQSTNAWQVMKPFVHFGIKATAAIAHTLIAIIKHIPKPGDHQKEKTGSNSKIVKI
ncbi:hypothetical protein LX99_00416 [Mucilaginibacter oryzae]|uniref:Uncharacterized protein n=1 Tax=Mucilaginibacter oryzae TaxID=468058 RepID=A0A316HP12_9SPHI|nr:hypothetical protein [Mucilaginibacter oryzae]PWK79955.1 hypothetical protein LX99_00416 [Mucilaginibacter oryzae]